MARRRGSYLGAHQVIHARPSASTLAERQAEARFAQEEFDRQREAERQKRLKKIERWQRSTGYLRKR